MFFGKKKKAAAAASTSQSSPSLKSTRAAEESSSTTDPSCSSSTPSLMDVSTNSSSDGSATATNSVTSSEAALEPLDGEEEAPLPDPCFGALRFTYLSVILVIFLADGLQGTHLYKLYDDYGFSVAWLYCLGFCTGGVLSPITGPWVDQVGRKKAAVIYCLLEILINSMEQYPSIWCVVGSRMIGGFTTNLLQCVFETWLDSEFRKRQATLTAQVPLEQREALTKLMAAKYEILMRDAVIVSNAAAIGSGYLSHVLSEWSGPVGPFRGAVVCTVAALAVVCGLWTENYGGQSQSQQDGEDSESSTENDSPASIWSFLQQAAQAFYADMRMLRVGIVQGLSTGVLYIFVFLWSPVLMDLAKQVPPEKRATTWGLDRRGEPAFGLIFMVFMSACVLGGVVAPTLRQAATQLLTPIVNSSTHHNHNHQQEPSTPVPREVSEGTVRPMAVEFLAATCYLMAASMLLVPCLVSGPTAFSYSLAAFCIYELAIGIVSPCEGVIRSLYFPAHARASVSTLPSFLVNTAVCCAVVCTEYVSLFDVCFIVVVLMMIASVLQISLITATEWVTLQTHALNTPRYARSLSFQMYETAKAPPRELVRFLSSRLSSSSSQRGSLAADVATVQRELAQWESEDAAANPKTKRD